MKFIIFSEYAELLDLAMTLQNEGHEVLLYIPEKDDRKIGDGIIPKLLNWWEKLGEGYIWVIDSCNYGNLQDWLRSKGEIVFGSSEAGDKLENERQAAQRWFKTAGFQQPLSKNFTSIDDALVFIEEHKDKKWVMKQNGDAPKFLNYMGKFDDNEDMTYHLEELKKSWNEAEYGKIDFDLMEKVEGLEVAASAFFNGKEFMKNKEGKVVGYLNFEEKKEGNGGTGETTGEMGTLFIGVTEDNDLFKDIILRPEILSVLKQTKFRGVFDINCIKTEKGIVALEPTCRPGVPSTSYEFMEGLDMPVGDMIAFVAKGTNKPIEIHEGIGMVMCLVAKPFPVLADIDDAATSMGERLWILKNGKIVEDFTADQKEHIHLYNFFKDGDYKVATKEGYLLTVTARGDSIKNVRENLIEYIKDNLYVSGMKYRTDIGKRVEDHYGISAEKEKTSAELENIKKLMKEIIYGNDE